MCESSIWMLKWSRTLTRTVKQIIPVRMVVGAGNWGQQIMRASKELVVYRDGLEVSRKKGGILAPFHVGCGSTISSHLWRGSWEGMFCARIDRARR